MPALFSLPTRCQSWPFISEYSSTQLQPYLWTQHQGREERGSYFIYEKLRPHSKEQTDPGLSSKTTVVAAYGTFSKSQFLCQHFR